MSSSKTTINENLSNEKKTFKLQTALCSICNNESTGIHFGAESCGSCSAFFRRSVVMGKIYTYHSVYCKSENKWKKCRACRLQKCYEMGMIKSAVQNKRDAIGKQSKQGIIAREISRNNKLSKNNNDNEVNNSFITSNIYNSLNFSQSKFENNIDIKNENILDEFYKKYQILKEDRKLLYTERCSVKLFDNNTSLEPTELNDFNESLYLLWRIEPRLIIKFISTNKFINCLHPEEKLKIYKYFIPIFQALEEPYLTWINGGINLNLWIMANKKYINISKIDEYFTSQNGSNCLNLDKETTVKLFITSFNNALEFVGKVMAEYNINEYEFVFLIALILFEPTIPNIREETMYYLQKLRNHVFKNMYCYEKYQNHCTNVDIRIGNIIMILSGVKVHTKTVLNNFNILRNFSLLPKNKLYDMDTFFFL
uniref:Nuclear receptor n=1 Tax=Strongyloides stercoralis TaxID=6248 RepID=A0A0K0E639_STRER